MRVSAGILLCVAALVLAACSSNPGSRALEGGGIGAAIGAVGTAIVGGPVLAGAVVGALTDESQIDLD